MADQPTFLQVSEFWVNLKEYINEVPTKPQFMKDDIEEWLDNYFKSPKETKEQLYKLIQEEKREELKLVVNNDK